MLSWQPQTQTGTVYLHTHSLMKGGWALTQGNMEAEARKAKWEIKIHDFIGEIMSHIISDPTPCITAPAVPPLSLLKFRPSSGVYVSGWARRGEPGDPQWRGQYPHHDHLGSRCSPPPRGTPSGGVWLPWLGSPLLQKLLSDVCSFPDPVQHRRRSEYRGGRGGRGGGRDSGCAGGASGLSDWGQAVQSAGQTGDQWSGCRGDITFALLIYGVYSMWTCLFIESDCATSGESILRNLAMNPSSRWWDWGCSW